MRVERILLTALLLGGCGHNLAGEESASDAARRYAQLVAQLGADEFDLRAAASDELRCHGGGAKAAIERGAASEDEEIRSRAEQLLRPIYRAEQILADWKWLHDQGPLIGTFDPSTKDEPADGKTVPDYTGKLKHGERGKAETEQTISACDYLATAQEPDGHWDSVKHGARREADVEQTSLALLALLREGNSEKVGAQKQAVRAAVAWLGSKMRGDGAILRDGGHKPDGLAHALAGIALAEAAGMTSTNDFPETKLLAQRALNYAVDFHQTEKSGFARAARGKPDLLTTTFFVMHLKSAKVAGLRVPPEAFDGAIAYVEDQDRGGRFRFFASSRDSARATLLGCLCRKYLGWKSEEIESGVQWALREYGPPDGDASDDLFNYIGVMVAQLQDRPTWEAFYQPLMERMNRTKHTDCSSNPRGNWCQAGRVFSTSLNCISSTMVRRWGL